MSVIFINPETMTEEAGTLIDKFWFGTQRHRVISTKTGKMYLVDIDDVWAVSS